MMCQISPRTTELPNAVSGLFIVTGLRGPEAAQCRLLIETSVAQVFGIHVEALSLPSRGKAPVAEARQVAMYLAHVVLRLPMKSVGAMFSRDRTTVAHACGVIEDRRDDPGYNRTIEMLEWAIHTLVHPTGEREQDPG